MGLLIKSARIIDPQSPFNGKTVDLFIEDGIIQSIQKNIERDTSQLVEFPNLHLSPGWFDMQVSLCDPGFEVQEDLNSGIKAAAAGGFTGLACLPTTQPPIHSKTEVEYVLNKVKSLKKHSVDVYPLGALSFNRLGQDLAELYDMAQSGAIGFTDAKKVSSDAGLLMRALMYGKDFNSVILTYCNDLSISKGGKMNEGVTSTQIGLKGIPHLAEELVVARNISIAEYTDCPIHLASISTTRSVELVRQGKQKGLKITASVNAYNLTLDDALLVGFDTNYKVDPPLRSKQDILALQKGLTDGTIDCITSDHTPVDIENKVVEFDNAESGNIGLETCFALVNTHMPKPLSLDLWVQKTAINPRKLFNLQVPSIQEGEKANLTLFDPLLSWELEQKSLKSKSTNTPLIGSKLKGKVIGVYNRSTYTANLV